MNNFCIFVGPIRTSTSWIYNCLKLSSAVDVSNNVKETYFFDVNYSKGIDWYLSHFTASHNITCDFSPTIFSTANVQTRLLDTFCKLKIVVILRDPIERSISHFHHLLAKGRCDNNIREAIIKYPDIISSSRYSSILPAWTSITDFDTLILDFKLLNDDPQLFLNQITDFLNIDPIRLTAEQSKPFGAKLAPKYPFLAKYFSLLSVYLRRIGLHSLV